MTIKELAPWINEKMVMYPELRSDFRNLYRLCLDEIEEGGSVAHEIELCINEVEQLIKDL